MCTAIALSDESIAQLAGGELRVPEGPVFTDGSIDLAQRTLVARLWSGLWTEFEATEQAILLAAQVFGLRRPERVREGRPKTLRARRRVLDGKAPQPAACTAGAGAARRGDRNLAGLAADLGFADHAHLTRTMRREIGRAPARVRPLLAGTD